MENFSEQQNVEMSQTIEESKVRRRKIDIKIILKNSIRFIIKHKLFFALLLLAILINILIFSLIPVIDAGKTKFVNLNTEVKISNGQTVKLKFSGVSVSIKSFTNETCPEGQRCYGNGQKSVEYNLVIDGKNYATGSVIKALNSEYQIETESSDYSTYAVIKITNITTKH